MVRAGGGEQGTRGWRTCVLAERPLSLLEYKLPEGWTVWVLWASLSTGPSVAHSTGKPLHQQALPGALGGSLAEPLGLG